MAKFTVSFTVETDDPLDEWCNKIVPGSTAGFRPKHSSACYSIPTTAIANRLVPEITYGYWRNTSNEAVFLVTRDSHILRENIEKARGNWERVTVEVLDD